MKLSQSVQSWKSESELDIEVTSRTTNTKRSAVFAEVTAPNPVEALIFQASSFQLLILESLLG